MKMRKALLVLGIMLAFFGTSILSFAIGYRLGKAEVAVCIAYSAGADVPVTIVGMTAGTLKATASQFGGGWQAAANVHDGLDTYYYSVTMDRQLKVIKANWDIDWDGTPKGGEVKNIGSISVEFPNGKPC